MYQPIASAVSMAVNESGLYDWILLAVYKLHVGRVRRHVRHYQRHATDNSRPFRYLRRLGAHQETTRHPKRRGMAVGGAKSMPVDRRDTPRESTLGPGSKPKTGRAPRVRGRGRGLVNVEVEVDLRPFGTASYPCKLVQQKSRMLAGIGNTTSPS